MQPASGAAAVGGAEAAADWHVSRLYASPRSWHALLLAAFTAISKVARMTHKYTIEALRELISVRRDSEQALRTVRRLAAAGSAGGALHPGAADCADAIRELEALVERLGGAPQAHGAVRRLLAQRLGRIAGRSCTRRRQRAILDACERGESWILEAYRNALDDHLPDFVRDAVLRQFEILMSTHDAIRGCRMQRPARGDRRRLPVRKQVNSKPNLP